ncbi:hypothetical protein V0U79_08305 [Hyphobacterium sp. HN65]|uniref:Bacterial repeat domain-containing protein n=1 Tax=Hyphobacterium lacteum TaxID=3116575 RepID=A0ABU7LRU7_9PROT|nr:hypothetical protein [Hyphobacterium sp. HN65]MEE2526366.1 hypothetical protein [Hyphobacterium sp. HN65]
MDRQRAALRHALLSFLAILAFAGPPSAMAQSAGTCGGLPFRQELDFWVGSWNVYSDSGAFLGRQEVSEWEQGCFLEAVWTGVGGDTAQSMNTYDPNLSGWRQLYISPTEIADLRGSFSNGTMTLAGNLFVQDSQTIRQRRLRISQGQNGSIDYVLEERDTATDPWTVVRQMNGIAAASDPQAPAVPDVSDYQPGQAICWNYPERDDFAFSAGDWSVGNASNRLSVHQSGCLIRERWYANASDTGVSYNFFDPFVNEWRQVWVSPTLFIDITGGAVSDGGPVQLLGTIHYTRTGSVQNYRGTWTAVSETAMTQLLEQQTNGVWSNWFYGNYIRRNTTATASIGFSGLGAGSVSSSPSGISCSNAGGACSSGFRLDQPVTFAGTAGSGSTFAGWSDGPCFGQTGDCVWNVGEARELEARFTLDSVPDGLIVAAVLPGARSGYVGGPDVTVFTSVVSRYSTPAQSCTITAPEGAPATLGYRRVDATNSPIGPANPVFDLTAGGSAAFVLALTPTEATPAQGMNFAPVITCENAALTPLPGVNTFALSIDTVPVPDILSIAVTPSADGVIRIPSSGGASFMSAAALNIGVGDGSAADGEATITVTADDGGAGLPVSLFLCETDASSNCLAPPASSVTTVFGTGAHFFAVFARAQAGSGIAFDPANARVYLRFTDANGVVRSVTSAAITAPD